MDNRLIVRWASDAFPIGQSISMVTRYEAYKRKEKTWMSMSREEIDKVANRGVSILWNPDGKRYQ